jgi:actin-related protein
VPLTLPDGTSISISEQDTKYCAEKLFQSFSVKITSARSTHDSYSADSDMKYKTARDEYDISIQQTILNSIERCPEEYRASQWKNISLSGGCTLLNGLRERLQNEIIASAADDVKINVSGVSNRDQTIWLGGSVLASNDDFRGHWISRDEYNSNGVSVIHQKCQTKLLRKNV